MDQERTLRIYSVLGYALMVLALVPMVYFQKLFSANPVVIVVQALAVLLMVWARLTFGSRSFHFAADPTQGGLVMTGPYHFIRHPIYTAVTVFALAGAIANAGVLSCSLLAFLVVGVCVRIYCEETLIVKEYPEYVEYAKRTKRVIPFVF